jgi:integrase
VTPEKTEDAMSRKLCAPTSLATWVASSLFVDFYRREFLLDLELSDYRLRCYEQAVGRLLRFCGGKSPKLGQVTPQLIEALIAACGLDRRSQKWRDDVRCCLIKIMRTWDPNFGRTIVPPAEPGTLRALFERHYVPERMTDATPQAIFEYRCAFLVLRRHVGADVRLDQLDQEGDAILADFFQHLLKSGRRPATINNKYRAAILAVWRDAVERGLVARSPRVKKLKEFHNPPDAWSIDEMKRILATAALYRAGEMYGPVRRNLWWCAILLLGYWTGLRRGSLLSIHTRDLDLRKAVLYVPGESMKNRQGQLFALPAEVVRAIRKIMPPERELLFECPVQPNTVSKHFKALLGAAGIRPGRHQRLNLFHKLRRTTCTELAARASTALASSLLGHSDEYVTARYIDPTRAKAHDVTKILPRLAVG